VVVLGAGGGIGSVAVATMAATADAAEILAADLDTDAAQRTARAVGDPRVSVAEVDVASPASLARVLEGARVAVNCVGPFYRFGRPVVEAAIAAGVDVVDVCDDLDATREILGLHAAARAAGVRAVVGMGNSPGLANLFVKMAAEWFLDEVHSAEIMHVHGGEDDEGPAVLKHRIHAMVCDVPLFVDGAEVTVRMLEPSGAAFVRDEDFAGLGTYPVHPYPHPETVTLPAAFPTLRRVTNLGVVFPLSYFQLTKDLVAASLAHGGLRPGGPRAGAGMDEMDAATVDGIVDELRAARPRLLADAGVDRAGGCLKVVVGGVKDGEPHTWVASLSSTEEGAGEGTGIPAGLAAVLALRGLLEGGPGVHPPEAVVPVAPLLELAAEVVGTLGVSGGGLPLLLEHVGPDGDRTEVPLPFGSG
jgi:saccharopine dehydrogenase (NAD+, L-lysine-forming)